MKILYKLQCLTNLHVGSGDANYSVIDNQVERDPVLKTPTIYASSMKGSLRAYFRENIPKEVSENTSKEESFIYECFGSDIDTKPGAQKTSTPGCLKFLPATLLARPLRVTQGEKAYALATSQELVNAMQQLCKDFSIQIQTSVECTDIPIGWPDEVEEIKVDKWLKFPCFLDMEPIAVLGHNSLLEIDLPIVARNQLDNGISKNLWYEEIVPHQSVFYTIVMGPDEQMREFNKQVHNQVIQFGGNASVGCGYTKVTCEATDQGRKSHE